MTTSTETYRRELVQWLRAGHVPPERIGEIVAEVESHVADTGEDPREAFGPARDYAAGFRHSRSRGSEVALVAPAFLCGFLVVVGMIGLVDGESVFGLPAWVALTAGLVLWIPALVDVLRRTAPVRDPRTGRLITAGPAAVALGMNATLAVIALACWGLAVLTS